jgi:hypothetical protein
MSKHWKNVERAIAKEIGGERNPVSGRTRGWKGDVENDEINVEVKYRSAPLPKWMLEAVDQADKAVEKSPRGQTPLVRIHIKGTKMEDDLVIMRWRWFKRFGHGE